MASKAELLQEAYNRGILPQDKIPLYEAAVERGLIQENQTKPQQADSFDAFIRGAGQGASFGLGEEIGAGLGTAFAYPVLAAAGALSSERDIPAINDVYSDILQRERGELSQLQQESPIAYTGGEIAGAIGTGLAGAATAPGKVLASSLGRGGLGVRALKGGATGAVSGGVYGFGSGEGGGRLDSAQTGAIFGAAGGVAAPVIGAGLRSGAQTAKTIRAGAQARGIEGLQGSLDALRATKNAAYKKASAAGAAYNDKAANLIGRRVAKALGDDPNPKLMGQTMSAIDDLQKTIAKGNFTLDKLEESRQILSSISRGAPSPETVAAQKAIRALDDIVERIPDSSIAGKNQGALELVKEARQANKVYKKSEIIAEVLEKADGDPNKIKAGLQRLAVNKKAKRQFSRDELAMIRDAAQNTTGEKLLKMAGKFGIDFGSSITPGNTVAPLLGGYLNPAIPVAGTAARGAQKYIARGKGEQLLRAIEGGSPSSLSQPRTGLLGSGAGGAALIPDNQPSKAGFMDTQGGFNRIEVTPDDVLDGGGSGNDTLQEPMGDLGAMMQPQQFAMLQNPYGENWQPSPRMMSGQYEAQDLEAPARLEPQPLPMETGFMQTALANLARNEGFSQTVYDDTAGARTVGFGFNMDSGIAKKVWNKAGIDTSFDDVYKGRAAISPQQGQRLKMASVEVALNDARSLFPSFDKLSDGRKDALLNLSFQMGVNRLGEFKKMRAAIEDGNFTRAAKELLTSKYAKQVPARAKEQARKLIRG